MRLQNPMASNRCAVGKGDARGEGKRANERVGCVGVEGKRAWQGSGNGMGRALEQRGLVRVVRGKREKKGRGRLECSGESGTEWTRREREERRRGRSARERGKRDSKTYWSRRDRSRMKRPHVQLQVYPATPQRTPSGLPHSAVPFHQRQSCVQPTLVSLCESIHKDHIEPPTDSYLFQDLP